MLQKIHLFFRDLDFVKGELKKKKMTFVGIKRGKKTHEPSVNRLSLKERFFRH